MAHRHRVHERAKGGKVDAPMRGRMSYTAKSNVEPEAKDTKDTFRRGGRHHGGLHAHGHKSKARADKRARGGGVGKGNFPVHTTHSPFSSAARGNDEKRFPANKDNHQPRKDGGAAFARGGRSKIHAGMGATAHGGGRPSPSQKHTYNYGGHNGLGHEEPLKREHKPRERAAGGAAFARGGHAHGEHHHAGHGAHHAHHPHHDGHHVGHHDRHGSHKAKGHKHRADGGKVDKEDD